MVARRDVVSCVAFGRAPRAAAAGLTLTSLTPLLKKNGKIRPVAAGEALRRLTGKALARSHAVALAETVGPRQFGVGTPGGAETLSRAAQVEAQRRPHATWVALDLRNAFSSLDRDAMLTAVTSEAPALLPYARHFLGRRSGHRYLGVAGGRRVSSCTPTKGSTKGTRSPRPSSA